MRSSSTRAIRIAGAVDEHLTAHYGSSPSSWGDDIAYIRVRPGWIVGCAFDKATVPGVSTEA
jgi:hypothetical protein